MFFHTIQWHHDCRTKQEEHINTASYMHIITSYTYITIRLSPSHLQFHHYFTIMVIIIVTPKTYVHNLLYCPPEEDARFI